MIPATAAAATANPAIAQASLGLQGISAIVSVMGAYGSVAAQKRQLQSQAEMARINAQLAEQSAQSALLAGQRQEQRSLLTTAGLKSTQRAAFAANGIDLGEGSAARVLTSTDVMGEIDRNTIAANAVRDAWGYRTQGVNLSLIHISEPTRH